MKLDEVLENKFNCLGPRKEINQKRVVEKNVLSTSLHIKQETEQNKANGTTDWDKPNCLAPRTKSISNIYGS